MSYLPGCPFSRIIYNKYIKSFVPVACGKCEFCKEKKRKDLFQRLYIEYCKKENVCTSLITLTYDNKNLKTDFKDIQRDFNLFFKRFYIYLKRSYNLSFKDLKYFYCIEPGGLTERLHLHLILFSNYRFLENELLKIVMLKWSNGFCTCKYIRDQGGLKYVVKYLFKSENCKYGASKGLGFKFKYNQNDVLNLVKNNYIEGCRYGASKSMKQKIYRDCPNLYNYLKDLQEKCIDKIKENDNLKDLDFESKKKVLQEIYYNRYLKDLDAKKKY